MGEGVEEHRRYLSRAKRIDLSEQNNATKGWRAVVSGVDVLIMARNEGPRFPPRVY